MYSVDTAIGQPGESTSNAHSDAYVVTWKEVGKVLLFCAADGVGGVAGGWCAAQYIATAFEQFAMTQDVDSPDTLEVFLREIDQTMQQAEIYGECSAVVGMVVDGVVYGASVGNARCWIYGNGFEYELTMLQYQNPLLGSGVSVPVGFGPVRLEKALLLGTDGFFNYTLMQEVSMLICDENCQHEAWELAELAKNSAGEWVDDTTVVLIRNEMATLDIAASLVGGASAGGSR